ncbi:TRAP transporter small permease subunit [Limibacillus halophilus]|uniref:TRAP transporter small permease protein n=1 Tax=Limibacillus halophilus TaxID=1579333 RepID=A0A839SUJ3_9PROT|nr:TRAP transporter small permease subunit [Limibacillus halophilus]MBB3065998.1 TRAP-type mannitol/chloroaromatic compound transport system permease small subunit [Limibacillus halophilus]
MAISTAFPHPCFEADMHSGNNELRSRARGWQRFLINLADGIDTVNDWLGRCISWLVPILVLNTCVVAILRYVFDLGWVWLQEMYVWTHGSIIMMAMGHTLLHKAHVRVDIIYEGLSERKKALTDLLGVLFFLLPMVGVVFWFAYPYVNLSINRLEGSPEAGGLPGLFLLKSTMLPFCASLGAQGISMACRSLIVLTGGDAGCTSQSQEEIVRGEVEVPCQ